MWAEKMNEFTVQGVCETTAGAFNKPTTGEMERMNTQTKNQSEMVQVNKWTLQAYNAFLKGYKQYKEAKKTHEPMQKSV